MVSHDADRRREMRVEVEITPGRANRARVNGAMTARARDALGVVRAVVFAPEDLAIVRGDPADRRRFLDDLIVQRSPRLAGVRADYDRVLKQRGALLKTAGASRRSRGDADLPTLDVWDAHLATYGAQLLAARLAAVAALRPHAVVAYAQVAPASVELELTYVSSLGDRLPPGQPPVEVLEAALLAQLSLRARPGARSRPEPRRTASGRPGAAPGGAAGAWLREPRGVLVDCASAATGLLRAVAGGIRSRRFTGPGTG